MSYTTASHVISNVLEPYFIIIITIDNTFKMKVHRQVDFVMIYGFQSCHQNQNQAGQ